MLSFKCALEGPSISFDDEEDEDLEYQSHFGMKQIPKNNRANNAPDNFIFNETFVFVVICFYYSFEGSSIAFDDEYKSHFEKPSRKNYPKSSGRGQSSKRGRGSTRARK